MGSLGLTSKKTFYYYFETLQRQIVMKVHKSYCIKVGVGNSFGFAGHIRDKLGGICGPVHVLVKTDFKVVFVLNRYFLDI